jgi:hypothetical protein
MARSCSRGRAEAAAGEGKDGQLQLRVHVLVTQKLIVFFSAVSKRFALTEFHRVRLSATAVVVRA